jgi:hypothetical protein
MYSRVDVKIQLPKKGSPMNKIEQRLYDAIVAAEMFEDGNTLFRGGKMFLHGHEIFKVLWEDGSAWVSLAGHDTRLTRSRLNVVLAAEWYLDAVPPKVVRRKGATLLVRQDGTEVPLPLEGWTKVS